jgi:cell division cycle 20-like protein 1 (cofactor of APC complex)
MHGHSARVGALAWNGDILSSGSRDRLILQRDVRTPSLVTERRLVGHRQEVRRKLFVTNYIITEK